MTEPSVKRKTPVTASGAAFAVRDQVPNWTVSVVVMGLPVTIGFF
jgi:hypothetical protein